MTSIPRGGVRDACFSLAEPPPANLGFSAGGVTCDASFSPSRCAGSGECTDDGVDSDGITLIDGHGLCTPDAISRVAQKSSPNSPSVPSRIPLLERGIRAPLKSPLIHVAALRVSSPPRASCDTCAASRRERLSLCRRNLRILCRRDERATRSQRMRI